MVELNISGSQNIDFAEVMRVIEELERFRGWCREVPPEVWSESESLVDMLGATSYGEELWDGIYNDLETMKKAKPARAIFTKEMRLVYGVADSLYPAVDEDSSSRIPSSVRRSIMRRDEGTCQVCGRSWHRPSGLESECESPLPSKWKPDFSPSVAPVMDHVIPASFGGPGEPWNVWVLCSPCNQDKFRELWPPAIRRAVDRLRCGDGYKAIDPPREQFKTLDDLLEGGG
jgi:hypothetical protein